MTSINYSYNSSSCWELSNPESPECIHNSAVHDKKFTMCFVRKFKRKRLNLLTDSKEKRRVVVVISASCAGYGVSSFFAKLFSLNNNFSVN